MDALVMCGGRGTRFWSSGATSEKPLYPVAGVPMVDRVRRALAESAIESVYAAVSSSAPETHAYLAEAPVSASEADVPLVETPGDGYVTDLGVALDDPRIDTPVVTVAADLALLDASVVDDVVAAYERHRFVHAHAPSMTVCVPVSTKERLGLRVESRLPTDEPITSTDERPESTDDPPESIDEPLAPTGLNVVGADDATQVIHVQDDTRLAINVNRVEDARIAQRAARASVDEPFGAVGNASDPLAEDECE